MTRPSSPLPPIARARPRAIAGALTSLEYDPDQQTMLMSATAPPSSTGAAPADEAATLTTVYIPVDCTTSEISVDGAAVLESVEQSADGSRLLYVRVLGDGGESYSVAVGRGR